MGTDEKPQSRLYEQPTESPFACPFTCKDCKEPLPDLFCHICGTILLPPERPALDLGSGPELLCDRCLGISS